MRRLLEIGLILSSLQLMVTGASAMLSPSPPESALMTASDGALTELGVQFHRVAADRFLPVYDQLFHALDPATTVRVVVADAEDEALFSAAADEWFPGGGGPTLQFVHTERPITSWMRDRLAVLPRSDGGTTLLAPHAPMTGPEARAHDWLVPWALGEAAGLEVRRSTVRFDGGDLIADADAVYVATPLFGRNPDLEETTLVSVLERELGRPVVALHDAPDHHIGMFLTPLGDGVVMVADPKLALDLLARSGRDPRTLVVGDAPVGRVSDEELAAFGRVAAELESIGLQVVPVPTLPTRQRHAWLSYNNVLLERRDGQLHVSLPVYGVEVLDRAATEIWESRGAVVHPIEVAGLFRLGGSVRCLVAPLVRG